MKLLTTELASNAPVRKQIDTSDLTWSELALLRKTDAFMYYSIPGARDNKLVGEEIDLSGLNLPDPSVSRSFTLGAIMNEPNPELIRAKQPRRNSDSVISVSTSVKAKVATLTFVIIKEEDEAKPPLPRGHLRAKSSVEIPMKPRTLIHRRIFSEPPESNTIVKRRTAISFETMGDDMISEIINEISELQPKQERSPPTNSDYDPRRGSYLQEVLFSSISTMMKEGDFEDSDEDK